MPEKPGHLTAQPEKHSPSKIAAVEAILSSRFPLHVLMTGVATVMGIAEADSLKDYQAPREAERTRLLALPDDALKQELAQVQARRQAQAVAAEAKKRGELAGKEAAKEAARFYNAPAATPDFDHWAKFEFWTFDEAIALLMGKEPSVLTPAAVKREVSANSGVSIYVAAVPTPPPPFLARYLKLCTVARRASAMSAAKLKPANVIAWAMQSKAVEPPSQLLHLLPDDLAPVPPLVPLAPVPSPAGAASQATKVKGSPKKWTDDMLAELEAFRRSHTMAATVEKFGISEGRVRQLLIDYRASKKNVFPSMQHLMRR